MKTFVIALVCAAGAFGGMYMYLKTQPAKPESDSVPTVADRPAEKESRADEESPQPRSTPKAKNRQSATPKMQPWTSAKPQAPANQMYYTFVPQRGSAIPDRVTIHNTPDGKLMILLFGTENSTGSLYNTKGSTSGTPKHQWEVSVNEGVLTVY